MLCPKCGFISFDHLSLCVKCHNDLSQVGSDLHGTATDAACRHFLDLVLKVSSSAQENPEQIEDATVTFVSPLEQDVLVENDTQNDLGPTTALEQNEFATTFPAEDSPALEFDLDEIPHLDISGFEQAVADENPTAAAEKASLNQEKPALDLSDGVSADQETYAFAPPRGVELQADEQPILHEEALEINSFSLSLDADEEATQLSGPPMTEDELAEPLAIDLDEIDLSDLGHDQGRTAPVADEAKASSAESTADYEDTMDLSLFGNDDNETSADGNFSPDDSLIPIDLTLMDEALVELAVDPGRKEAPLQKKSPAEDLELSMEDNHN